MKLSVLITYHNEGPWLTECLASVLPQLANDDEVIVHDDASRLPARSFLVGDARIKSIVSESNVGPARARNRLLEAASGELVHFHDADDVFDPSWRGRVLGAFDPETEVVLTDVQSFDDKGNHWAHVMGVEKLIQNGNFLAFALDGGVLVPSGTYRRATVRQIGGYREEMWQSEDYDFHIRLALANAKWRVITEDLVRIRRHDRQRSHLSREVWTSAVDALEHLAEQFPTTARPAAARAATRAASMLFAAGARADAERAFELADRFGGPRYDRPVMQRMTAMFGAMQSETIAAAYRRLLPRSLRAHAQRSGW